MSCYVKIPVGQGREAKVSLEDAPRMSMKSWHTVANKTKNNWYARRLDHSGLKNRWIVMHRNILNPPENMDIDHINGDGLDNRRTNLRVCTHRENHLNRKSDSGSTSKYKGVCWNKNANKWKAQIKGNGKCIYLGYFTDELEAAKAYNEAAIKYFGEFAWLNDIEN